MGATLGNAPFSSDSFVFSRRINKLRFFSIAPASLVANVLDDHGPFNTPIPSIYINSYKKVIDTFFSIHEVYNPLIFTDKLILTITEGLPTLFLLRLGIIMTSFSWRVFSLDLFTLLMLT